MKKHLQTILIPVLLISILVLPLISGCAGESTTAEPVTTAPEAAAAPVTTAPQTTASESVQSQQILADMIAAVKNIESYKFTMDMKSFMETTGDQAGNVNMVMNSRGFYNQLNKNMYMTMEIDIDMDIPEVEAKTQKVTMDMYMLDEYLYMKMDMPVIGEQWMKMPITDEIREAYNTDLVNEQLELLASSIDIEFLKYEAVDGVNCYVFKVIPDVEKLLGWALEQQMADTGLNTEDIKNISDVFKEFTYTVWLTKEDKLPRKIDSSMSMNFTSEMFGESDGDMDSMAMNMDMTITMYDYNIPETIVLPEEAENAIEMPQTGDFSQNM